MTVRCRKCKNTNSVASVDHYIGTCHGSVKVAYEGDLNFEPYGYTEINWDSCEQTGWCCLDCLTEVRIDTTDPLDDLSAALKRLVEVIP